MIPALIVIGNRLQPEAKGPWSSARSFLSFGIPFAADSPLLIFTSRPQS